MLAVCEGATSPNGVHETRALSQRHFHWRNRGQKARGPRRNGDPPAGSRFRKLSTPDYPRIGSDPCASMRMRRAAFRARVTVRCCCSYQRTALLPLETGESCGDGLHTFPLHYWPHCTPFDFTASVLLGKGERKDACAMIRRLYQPCRLYFCMDDIDSIPRFVLVRVSVNDFEGKGGVFIRSTSFVG